MPDTAKIVVTRRIPEPAVELLREAGEVWVSPDDRPLETDELHDAVKGADIAVTLLHDKGDDAFLDAAGDQLRAVCNVAVGFDNVDVPAATKRGVLITNTPGVLTEATADLAMTLILAVTRRIGGGGRLRRAAESGGGGASCARASCGRGTCSCCSGWASRTRRSGSSGWARSASRSRDAPRRSAWTSSTPTPGRRARRSSASSAPSASSSTSCCAPPTSSRSTPRSWTRRATSSTPRPSD